MGFKKLCLRNWGQQNLNAFSTEATKSQRAAINLYCSFYFTSILRQYTSRLYCVYARSTHSNLRYATFLVSKFLLLCSGQYITNASFCFFVNLLLFWSSQIIIYIDIRYNKPTQNFFMARRSGTYLHTLSSVCWVELRCDHITENNSKESIIENNSFFCVCPLTEKI